MKISTNGTKRSGHLNNGDTIPHREALAELQRVVDSPDFETSDRNRAFLRFVVENTLAGRRVKGYDVAVEVFGRPASFNATTDPIVRIECGKLRKALEVYYLKSGRRNPLRLAIPKGSYRAVFSLSAQNDHPGHAATTGLDPALVTILRAALLGWSEDREEGALVWSELNQRYPGFPFHPQAIEILESVRRQDAPLRDLITEGLGRFNERMQATSRMRPIMAMS